MTRRYKSRVRRAINKIVRAKSLAHHPDSSFTFRAGLLALMIDPKFLRRHFPGAKS